MQGAETEAVCSKQAMLAAEGVRMTGGKISPACVLGEEELAELGELAADTQPGSGVKEAQEVA